MRDERTLERVASLAIPPAWKDVWICRSARGHLQATGIDDAGRKQYRYHPRWREEREREKYERILRFAERLPALRATVRRHLRRRRIDREKALAALVAVLDRTHLRIGTEEYAEENGTYGLATLRSRHLEVEGDRLVLDFKGKGGKRQHAELTDPRLARVVAEMDELPGYEVFSYLDEDGHVVDVRSEDVNLYLKEHAGEDFSAKDFRTWAGTVAAGVALAELDPVTSASARQRAVAGVVRTVADLLGNTAAVCRASYIDPRIIDAYHDGHTIATLAKTVRAERSGEHSPQELAVLALLSRGLEERAAA